MAPSHTRTPSYTEEPVASQRLIRADKIPKGRVIWIEDDDEVWQEAEVIEQNNTLLTCKHRGNGSTVEVDLVSRQRALVAS